MKNNKLINVTHVRDFALKFAQDNRRGWQPKRISQRFIDDLNTKVRLMIQSAVMHHPSVGKTIKNLF